MTAEERLFHSQVFYLYFSWLDTIWKALADGRRPGVPARVARRVIRRSRAAERTLHFP